MKVLLVEDEPKLASFIKKGFKEQGHEVDVAYDGVVAQRLALQNQYDIIILDVILPYANGLEVCKNIRKNNTEIPIMFLTALGSTEDIITGLDVGADDYMIKPFKFDEFLARIRALTRRKSKNASGNTYKIADLEVNTNAKIVMRNNVIIQLTAREYALMEFFAKNVGRVLSRSEIAQNVWDISFDTGTNVVDVYVNYLRNKIDKGYPTKLIHTVFGMGYILKDKE